MKKVFFGFAIADGMFPTECTVSRKTLTVDEVRYWLPIIEMCLNPSHKPTIEVATSKFGFPIIIIPDNAPTVTLKQGDSIIIMSFRGLPRLEGRHEYTPDEIASATFTLGEWIVTDAASPTEQKRTTPDSHTPAKNYIYTRISGEDWMTLCQYLREWHSIHCPRYRRDEVEGTIGSWVGRAAIVKAQLDDKVRNHKITPAERERQLRWEIDAKWDGEFATYQRTIDRINNDPPAEKHVAEVLARLATRKEAKT